jgi:hypothetical protein
MRPSETITVESGWGAAPVASINVTCVIAIVAGREEEHDASKTAPTIANKNPTADLRTELDTRHSIPP